MREADLGEVARLQAELERERHARQLAVSDAEQLRTELASRILELDKTQRSLQIVQEVAIAANEATTIESALHAAIRRVCEYTGWPVGHVYVPDPELPSELLPTKIWHFGDEAHFATFREVTESTKLRLGVGLPGRVYASGKPAWVIDVTRDTNFPRAKLADAIGVRAGFGFPVLVGNEVAAVLEFFSEHEHEPDAPLLELMANLGTQLGRVIERTRTESIRMARDAAEAANRTKSTFLANMSHELRTPLNAIIGYSEMLVEEAEELGSQPLIADLQKINTAGRHLLSLISNILDLSKIEAGRMDLFLETFDLNAMLDDVETTVRPLVEKNTNQLVTRRLGSLGLMHADLTKVRQLLFNLLSNASKFTSKGTITLSVEREKKSGGDVMVFRVSDTGIGMTQAQVARLFQAFSQADASTTRQYGGTGLGLAITKHMCQMMGGDVSVDSELAQGTTFTLRLPAEVRVTTEQQAAHVTTELPELPKGGANTILVIDNDPTVRELLLRFLTREGFRVIAAAGGEEGLRLARELKPMAITLDVMMPGMDGWSVLSALKRDPRVSHIPVVMVTIVDDKNLGYAMGAADYLTKPVDREHLVGALNRWRHEGSPQPLLVVEEDAATRELLRRMLEREGFPIITADSGRAAITRLSEHTPSAILLDLDLRSGELDGFTLVDELRRHASWSKIPVIMMTANDTSQEEGLRLSGGVERMIQKGTYSRDTLLAEVRKLVASCVLAKS